MKRRVLSAAVLAGAGLVAFGSSGDRAATSGPQAAQYVVVRTNSGPTSVNVSVGFGEGGAPAFGGLVGATVSAGQIDQVGIGITAIDNHRPDPVVKAGHRWVDGCAVGKCEVDEVLASGFAVSYWDSGQPGGLNRFYIVVEGGSPTITVAGIGWQLEAATLDYRYVDGMHSGLASVYAVQQGAEVFESAHLPGGADGSITVGAAPCSNAVAGTGGEPAGVGAGKVRLTGGRTSPTLFCPTLRDPDLASWAVGATQWKLEGRMVGNSTLNEVRLLVIDLPPSGAGSLASDPLAP